MKQKFKIVVENSAPSQKKPAKSVSWSAEILRGLGANRVAEIGCGRLRNLKILQSFFSDITLVDTKLQCDRIRSLVPKSTKIRLLNTDRFRSDKKKYHAIFVISVLHIIPEPKARHEIISLAINKVFGGGYIVIDVPCGVNYYRKKCTSENRYRDGWVMGNGPIRTFYKNYSAKELDLFLTNGKPLEVYEKVWFGKHIIRIMKQKS